jgi:hypothetical protein
MQNSTRFTVLLLLVMSLSSCFKEERPVPKNDRGPLSFASYDMGSRYDSSLYYSLLDKKNTKTVNKYDWHLGFYSDSSSAHIIINTGIPIKVYKTLQTQFEEVTDSNGFSLLEMIEFPNGDLDSLALKDVLNTNVVYALDLGRNADLQWQGFRLIKIKKEANSYSVQYTQLGGVNPKTESIPFTQNKNYHFYNLLNGQSIYEPYSKDWEIQFKQYLHIYYNPFQTYAVVGCHINPERVKAYQYKGSKKFKDIDLSDVNFSNFSDKKDVIGFSWKRYDLNANVYVIDSEKSFVLLIDNLKLYKLHFVGFYNNQGEKGCPQFEYVEL